MTVIESTIVIHCQPEEAFERLSEVVHDPGGEITECVPPRRLVEVVRGRVDATISYNVHSAYDGTRLTSVMYTRPRGLHRLTAPLRVRRWRMLEQHRLDALREALEHPN